MSFRNHKITIPVRVDNSREVILTISQRNKHSIVLFDKKDSHKEHGEARFQLVEGNFYDYKLSDEEYRLKVQGFEGIVQENALVPYTGRIAPNIYVGTLELTVWNDLNKEEPVRFDLEVQSKKTDYRSDYRTMMEEIMTKSVDLILASNSPVLQNLNTDFSKSSENLYQRFAFIKSFLESEEFNNAINRIVYMPVTRWQEEPEEYDVRRVKRFKSNEIRALGSGQNRRKLPESHFLRKHSNISSLPGTILTHKKTDTVDTPENRFVKYALEHFLAHCTEINFLAKKDTKKRLSAESKILIDFLEHQLQHQFFSQISRPSTLNLNNPVLQRRSGYRTVLRVWLQFELAACLTWEGGEEIYKAGQKNIANLYEYWLFFKLLDLFEEKFEIKAKSLDKLFKYNNGNLDLNLKQGSHIALGGIYTKENRKLRAKFNYNRSFGSNEDLKKRGSWTTTLRPDYTLSIWPEVLTEEEAEEKHLIVHIHFDAKYKVDNLRRSFIGGEDEEKVFEELNKEKEENRKGTYKNADLLKMHAYKDAIRRTGGAYILYPGDNNEQLKGFHEIIPGLGAFSIKPKAEYEGQKTSETVPELSEFIDEVIKTLQNRISQYEKLSDHRYAITSEEPDEFHESLPEYFDKEKNEKINPNETFIIIGYCKSRNKKEDMSHYKWITEKGVYNFRLKDDKGRLDIDDRTLNAKYLLLRNIDGKGGQKMHRIITNTFKVWSKEQMLAQGYLNPRQDEYLIVELERESTDELGLGPWDYKALKEYGRKTHNIVNPRSKAGIPFVVNLIELSEVKA